MTVKTGALWRTKASKSIPVIENAPSPQYKRTSLSGAAILAARAYGTPTPNVPRGPGSIHAPGCLGCTAWALIVTTSPPSPI